MSERIKLTLEIDTVTFSQDSGRRGSARWLAANAAGLVISPGPPTSEPGVIYGPQLLLVSRERFEMVRLAWWTRKRGEVTVTTHLHLITPENASVCCQHPLTPGAVAICQTIVQQVLPCLQVDSWLPGAFVLSLSPLCRTTEQLLNESGRNPEAANLLRDFLEDHSRLGLNFLHNQGEWDFQRVFHCTVPDWQDPPPIGWEGVRAMVGDEYTPSGAENVPPAEEVFYMPVLGGPPMPPQLQYEEEVPPRRQVDPDAEDIPF